VDERPTDTIRSRQASEGGSTGGHVAGAPLMNEQSHDIRLLIQSYEAERVKVLGVWSEFSATTFLCGRERMIHADEVCGNTWCTSASARAHGFGTSWGLMSARRPFQNRKRVWNS
jgi:hypothetical protein